MEVKVVCDTIAKYYSSIETRFLAEGSYSDEKPHAWKKLSIDRLVVGNAVLSGEAVKKEGEWHVEKPFRVVEEGQERTFEIKPEEIEELCNLSVWNEEGFKEKLFSLAGVRGEIAARRVAGIGARINCEDSYIEIELWEKEGKLYPKKIWFFDQRVGEWKMDLRLEKEKLGVRKWDIKEVDVKRQIELKNGRIKEKRSVMNPELEMELKDSLNKLIKGVFHVGKKDRQGGDIGKREITEALEEISRKRIPFGRTRDLDYETNNFFALVNVKHSSEVWWRVKMADADRFGSEPQVGEKLTTLMEEAMETGDESNLVEFCKELLGQGKSRSFNGGKKPCR